MRSSSVELAVVIPLYNAAPWIERAVNSVLSQDCPRVHVIVVDDGSTDGSLAELEKFGKRITVESGPNRGACHARNLGLALAEKAGAELILFLDADDYLEGNMLAGSIAEAKTHAADMVVSNMHIELPDGTRYERPLYHGDIAPETFFYGWLAERGYVNPSGIVWRTSFVRQIGGWDESLSKYQDLDIEMRAMLQNPRMRKNESGNAIHSRINPNSITKSHSEHSLQSRYKAIYGLIGSVQGTSFEHMLPLLHEQLYNVARTSFREGYREMGREIMDLLRSFGYRKHAGTWKHRVIAQILGLETKVRLWGA